MPPPRHGSGSTPSSANDWAPDVNSQGHAALRMTVTTIGRWSPHQLLFTRLRAVGPTGPLRPLAGTSAPQTGHKSESWGSFRVIQAGYEIVRTTTASMAGHVTPR